MSKSSLRPSVVFDYPTSAYGPVPACNSIEEEAEWWDTHDSGDYDEEFVPVKVTFGPDMRRGEPKAARTGHEARFGRPGGRGG